MKTDICVTVPTIRRPECVEDYVANARRHGFDTDRLEFVLVTEDVCDTDAMRTMLDDLGVEGRIFDGTERERWFEEHGLERYGDLIPEASHAQTSFGLLYMWHRGHDVGVFVDDDTLPLDDHDFFGRHLDNLGFAGELDVVSSDERWVNVLHDTPTDLYPRGYPYAAMDEEVSVERDHIDSVVASQGLWTDVPDLDAVRILMDGDLQGQAQTRLSAEDYGDDFVAADGQYLTVCSMNLAFRREVIPAFYQFPMDDNPWDVGRFDDIWSGVVLKRAADLMGDAVHNGAPLCKHEKAPRSTFGDLANEVAGLELNEHVWAIVDGAEPDVDGREGAEGYAGVAGAIADALAGGDWSDWENGAFLNECGEALHDWIACCEALAPRQAPAAAD